MDLQALHSDGEDGDRDSRKPSAAAAAEDEGSEEQAEEAYTKFKKYIRNDGVTMRTFTTEFTRRWAKAKIDGETVVVWAEGVSNPVAVRYGYESNPAGANLYNRAGLPASPFRTGD